MTTIQPPRTPAKRKRGQVSTMTPTRLGGVASAILQGDSIKAACHSALVPEPTYTTWRQRGEAAIIQARTEMDEDDVEGRVWAWIEDGGGFGMCDPRAWYWEAPTPRWWPRTLTDRWTHVVFVMVIAYARARAEQVYRATVTRAAQGTGGQPADWKAAQFMLTHSFGWRDASRVEVTGADGGPIEMQANQEQVLAALAALAQKRRTLQIAEGEQS
ncbi:terminase small subunit [Microbacterium phage Honeyfin]|uniref:Terminase small subunit n=1 Tax=Microbacterium phage Honeyfin TaxID=2871520 RepID=A0AAE7XES2_9CAUD|nr:terminase small subunit [Microbacterium phage Honeyfin]QZD98936.1 terminase small subunit [Microbacterium phage Honeyfin]